MRDSAAGRAWRERTRPAAEVASPPTRRQSTGGRTASSAAGAAGGSGAATPLDSGAASTSAGVEEDSARDSPARALAAAGDGGRRPRTKPAPLRKVTSSGRRAAATLHVAETSLRGRASRRARQHLARVGCLGAVRTPAHGEAGAAPPGTGTKSAQAQQLRQHCPTAPRSEHAGRLGQRKARGKQRPASWLRRAHEQDASRVRVYSCSELRRRSSERGAVSKV